MKIAGRLFSQFIKATHWATREPWRAAPGRLFMRGLGWATLKIRGARPRETPRALGEEWQRMFPSKKMVPLTEITDDTVYAEIRSPCPYRGSGNVEGCYRMMEYDRRMMEEIGGEFVVLRSQAEPGVETCRVAMRPQGSAMEDLEPAHVRYRREQQQQAKNA